MKNAQTIGLFGIIISLALPASANQVPQLAAGGDNSMAIKYDSSAWSWGANDDGQLGNGTNGFLTLTHIPQHVSNIAEAVSIAIGIGQAMALNRNHQLLTWGDDAFGQLGNGNNISTNLPWRSTYISDVAAIAAGRFHSMALTAGGNVWTFGYNYFGELGNGANGPAASTNIPVLVTGVVDIVSIAGGGYHSLALQSNGTIWAWGWNGFGQLGTGTTKTTNTPVQVSGISNAGAIAAGWTHSLVLTHDNHLWAWGYNAEGQLGIGSSGPGQFTNVPVLVMADVVAVSAGEAHSAALKGDGTVWTWGKNLNGELGTGSSVTNSAVPVQVVNLTNVVAIAAGANHTLALQADGALYAWGKNNCAQAGIDWLICLKTNLPTLVTNWPQNITAPAAPAGTTNGYVFSPYLYASGGSTSLWGRALEYQFDFGNGSSTWSAAASASNTWTTPGTFAVRARARSAMDPLVMSDWSAALTVVINANPFAAGDYDGDGLADPGLYIAGNGTWQILLSSQAYLSLTLTGLLGESGWLPASADYDGDRLADPMVYEPSGGDWELLLSSAGYRSLTLVGLLGAPDWLPASADYDGDRLADPMVYEPSGGNWKILLSSAGYMPLSLSGFLGAPGWLPASADYDGDRLADPMVYETAGGNWRILLSSAGYMPLSLSGFLGATGWLPASADYDGDRLADPAVYNPTINSLQLRFSSIGYASFTVPNVF